MSKKVLVICGDQYHSADVVIAGLLTSGEGQFEFIQAPDGPLLDFHEEFSAVVLAKLNVCSPKDSTPWTTETSDKALGDYVNSGGGLLVVHAGTVGYSIAPLIHSMTGGSFIRHPEACDVTVQLLPNHFMTTGCKSFTVHDEHYWMDVNAEREDFLMTHSHHGVQPGGWTKPVGKGKVCTITPGHFEAVWNHPDFQGLIRNGLTWVTNG